jgi:hypothetical protein
MGVANRASPSSMARPARVEKTKKIKNKNIGCVFTPRVQRFVVVVDDTVTFKPIFSHE